MELATGRAFEQVKARLTENLWAHLNTNVNNNCSYVCIQHDSHVNVLLLTGYNIAEEAFIITVGKVGLVNTAEQT